MPDGVVKVQKNKNITLPAWLMRRFHVEAGDYLLLQETENGVLLKPAKLVDPSQAYFWTKEWQSGEGKAEEDIQQGRVKRFKNVNDLMRELRR